MVSVVRLGKIRGRGVGVGNVVYERVGRGKRDEGGRSGGKNGGVEKKGGGVGGVCGL